MFLGTHEHTIDDKNRLTLPARFRDSFADGVVLARGIDRCIDAFSREDWLRRVNERFTPLDPLSKETRRLQRHHFSGAAEADLDKQGRVMIPAPLIDHAALGREVVVAGTGDHLEIWDRDAWRREVTEFEGSAEDVAERVAAKNG